MGVGLSPGLPDHVRATSVSWFRGVPDAVDQAVPQEARAVQGCTIALRQSICDAVTEVTHGGKDTWLQGWMILGRIIFEALKLKRHRL